MFALLTDAFGLRNYTKEFEWTRENYEKSISSRCWWYTSYDAGWNGCREYGTDISTDDELRQIAAMEQELGVVFGRGDSSQTLACQAVCSKTSTSRERC